MVKWIKCKKCGKEYLPKGATKHIRVCEKRKKPKKEKKA